MIRSNKFYESFIYFLHCNNSVLQLGSIELPTTDFLTLLEKSGVLIWENQGTFAIFAPPILQNIKIRYENARSIEAAYPRIKPPKGLTDLLWDQGTRISPTTVSILLAACNHSDELSKTDTPADPATKGQPDQ